MAHLNYLVDLFRYNKIVWVMTFLISSIAIGGVFYDDINVGGLTVTDLTADTVPYSNSSKVLTSSAVTPTELGLLAGQDQNLATTDDVTFNSLILTDLTATTVPYLDGSKLLTSSAVTPTELGYLSGVTSALQTQMDAKLDDFTSTTDNAIMRSDGTGGAGIQDSNVIVDDSDSITGIVNATLTGLLTAVGLSSSDPVILAHETTPSNPSSGFIKIYPKNDDTLYLLNSAGIEAAIGTGGAGGAGGINHITNPDIESSADDYNDYDDGAVSVPVDGTGGTASNLTITRTTTGSELIRGIGSLKIAKGAADAQGEGTSIDFTIDNADKGNLLEVTLLKTSSVNFVYGDVTLHIYDVTNAALINVSNSDDGKILPSDGIFRASFLAASDSASYRLIFHTTTTNANAYDLFIDEVSVGPFKTAPSTFSTERTSFTPTGSWTTNTTYSGFYRRIGDSAAITYLVSTAGAPTSAALTLSLPPGLEADETKMHGNAEFDEPGFCEMRESGVGLFIGGVGYTAATNNITVFAKQTSAAFINLTQSVPFTWGAGDTVQCTITIPILGWNAGGEVSPGEVELIRVEGRGNAAGSMTADVTNIDFLETSDVHSAWNGSQFTATRSAWYEIEGVVGFTAGTSAVISAYIDGTIDKVLAQGATQSIIAVSNSIYLTAGQVLSLRVSANLTLSNQTNNHQITITESPDFKMFSVSDPKKVITSTVTPATFTPGANVWGNITSIILTPGTWIIHAAAYMSVTADGNGGQWFAAISTGSTTTTTDHVVGDNVFGSVVGNLVSTSSNTGGYGSIAIPGYVATVTDTTTYYLKANKVAGTLNQRASGRITALRY